jgi:hypothetical protein
LQFLGGHDGDEHNTHQNIITIITNTMMILILMIFTYSHSDSKNKTYYVGKQYQQSQWKLNETKSINHHS